MGVTEGSGVPLGVIDADAPVDNEAVRDSDVVFVFVRVSEAVRVSVGDLEIVFEIDDVKLVDGVRVGDLDTTVAKCTVAGA